MADYSDPKRATAYRFTISLYARSDNQIKTTPTLAAGDVKVSKDNGATANITTLPAETPASSGILQVDLSGTEMTADLVTVIFRDAAGAEWNDVAVHIATSPVQMGDLATAANLATVDTVVDAILVDTAEIGAAGAGLTAVPWNAAWDAEVQSEVADALAVYDPPTNAEMEARTLVAASYATAAALATVDNEIAVIDGIVDSILVDTAEIGAAGAGLTALATASALATVDTVVDAILVDTDTTIPATLATIAGYIDTEVAAIKAKTDLIPAAPAAVGDIPSAATIADAVWDEAIAGHAVAGSTGEQLAAAGAAGDPWATALPGAYSAGSAGKIVGDSLDAAISSRLATASYAAPLDAAGTRTAVGLASANLDTQIGTLATAAALTTVDNEVAVIDGLVDAIKAKTDSLTFTVAGQVDSNIQYVNDVQVNGTGAAGNEWGP
jgi:hypothetical protein